MSSRVFYKMTGSGNDFVMLDGRHQRPADWTTDRIVAACDRRQGVGADGVVLLAPEPDGVRMHFWNRDGSVGAMCGNAALCSTVLAARLGLAPADGMWLVTGAGRFRTRTVGQGWNAELNLPPFARPVPVPKIALEPGEEAVALATVGVEHLVLLVADVEAVDIERRGTDLRWHPAAGEGGANVNFISPPTRADSDLWRIRTWERGVEGETLACGTGTVAAAAMLACMGHGEFPIRFQSTGGPVLAVAALCGAEVVEDVWLAGEGRLVYEGHWP